jgi:hypothetical protein
MAASRVHKIKITFSSSGAVPPVYVAGAFTKPPWHPTELESEKSSVDDAVGVDEYVFWKDFEVEEGSWQYKFRLGDGEWWVCDGNAEIGTVLR